MRYLAFIFFTLLFSFVSVQAKQVALTLFQNQIKDCELDLIELKSIKNFSVLYAEIKKKYLITSEKILYRELYFQAEGEKRKIKIANDVVELFRVDNEDMPTKLGIDPRHKNKTTQALVNQLTLNAKIENDWQKSLELRENSLRIEIVRVDEKITQLKVLSGKNTNVLDCQVVNTSEVCLCNK